MTWRYGWRERDERSDSTVRALKHAADAKRARRRIANLSSLGFARIATPSAALVRARRRNLARRKLAQRRRARRTERLRAQLGLVS